MTDILNTATKSDPTTASGQETTSVGQTTTATGYSDSTLQGELTTIGQTTTSSSRASTTPLICKEKEYIDALVFANAIRIRPNTDVNTQDLITKGLDIADEKSTFKIDLPEGGLLLRDVKLSSLNIEKVEMILMPESGTDSTTIQGVPTSLPVNEFPSERIGEIIIKVLQTSDNNSLKQVKLSIIACEEATTTTTSTRKFCHSFLFKHHRNLI